ncbi:MULTISPECIES: ABC transporter permease [Streptomyces]|uniref:ABC transporter permease n=1 Tax=Streptomyces tendae TaxID=1932 RepID=A0A6B3QZF2_STRTE|nr:MULTISPECIES: ABC transporter permease [Streptomyces]BET52002.1 ABC transporter permease [Kitasatospora aureofaciens]MBQ0966599.1 ABC transporter permease [Streptomyces sp. RK74B]MBQ1007118.1 ABC transporter permease [Streptomyces sp. RK23]MCW1099232.1 ABC transporter permease [Streptomyces sp. RS2]MZG16446.1 ABC transporter permease subunit [Streptomyces sp. SID5914]
MVAFLRLALRRVAMMPVMVLGIALLVFVVLQFSPTDPAYNALGESASPAARAAFAEANGLDDPLPVRYFAFLGDLLRGDLGVTMSPSQPVTDRIATAFPLTLQLTLLGLALAVVLALAFGVLSAVHRDRWPDQVFRVLSMAGIALPSFWIGVLLIQQFALNTPLFPTGGYVNPADSFSGWLESMTLPALSLALPVASSLARLIRTSMVTELDRDYVRTARGSGLPPFLIIRSVLRNALVTPLTVLGVKIGYMLSGAVVIEAIFDLPGMGKLILEGVNGGDVGLVQGTVLTIAIAFLVVNVVVDLLYLLVNPRIRTV